MFNADIKSRSPKLRYFQICYAWSLCWLRWRILERTKLELLNQQNIFWDFLANPGSILASVRVYQKGIGSFFLFSQDSESKGVLIGLIMITAIITWLIKIIIQLEGLVLCNCHCPKRSVNIIPSMQPIAPWCSHNLHLPCTQMGGFENQVKQISWGHSNCVWWNSYLYQSNSEVQAGSWKKN